MTAGRPTSLITTCDQWVRASHEDTAVDPSPIGVGLGELTLSWPDPEDESDVADDLDVGDQHAGCSTPGLATDRLCRVYRLRPTTLERWLVGATVDGLDYHRLAEPEQLVVDPVAAEPTADFTSTPEDELVDATGIAVDDDDRIFIADRARQTISVTDVWSRRLLRTVHVATSTMPGRFPMGLATDGTTVHAAVQHPAGLLRFTATTEPVEVELPEAPDGAVPTRVATLPDGSPVVLVSRADGESWLVAGAREPLGVGRASDIAVDVEGVVVVAPCAPGEDDRPPTLLRRWAPVPDRWLRKPPLDATGYDGGGIVRTRDGRIVSATATSLRLAVAGRVTYAAEGTCVTYRLDSGTPRNRWGRVLLEACLPEGTAIHIGAVTTDDEFETEQAAGPADPAECVAVVGVDAPPLPPAVLEPAEANRRVHTRSHPTTPWWRHLGRFHTLEAPVTAPAGRYLWLTIRLRGDTRRTPRIRDVRVEHHAHALTNRLPRVFTEDPVRADFLSRYLAPLDGLVHDLDLRSRCRDILVDPRSTPSEALEWLASFFGLVLDSRWADAARRRLVEEIVWLYRRRGTLGALTRYIEIFLAGDRALDARYEHWVSPIIVEHFRLRGVSGAHGDDETAAASRSVLGFGFRIGGAIDDPSGTAGSPGSTESSAETAAAGWYAHRFSVLVPTSLGVEDEAAVRTILDTERPAHTTYELCTVDAGMRLGRGLHLGMSSIVGPTGGFESAVVDRSLLGRRAILGGRTTGLAVDAARIGRDARVG